MPRSGRSRMGTSNYRPAVLSVMLVAFTVGWGLAVRFAPLGLPRSVVKYGGSALWALTIYWLVSAFASSRQLLRAAIIAGALATTVELGKLLHAPTLDAFRRTLPGVLLLGRHFSVQDILVYWLAVVLGMVADRRFLRR